MLSYRVSEKRTLAKAANEMLELHATAYYVNVKHT